MTDIAVTEEDVSCMGTMEEALSGLLKAYRAWTPYQQPLMASSAGHKKREAMAREADHRLVQAAALVGWHLKRDEELRSTTQAAE